MKIENKIKKIQQDISETKSSLSWDIGGSSMDLVNYLIKKTEELTRLKIEQENNNK